MRAELAAAEIASSAVVHPGVALGAGAVVEDFVVLGVAPRGHAPGELPLRIGSDAVVRSHTVIYAGSGIGDRFQAGHGVLVRESNQIGSDVSVGTHSVVEHHVVIGDRVRIHSNAFVPEYSVIEDDAWIGPNVVFTNALYPRSAGVKEQLVGPRVRTGAKVGANATLLPGVTVGANALVGAGSVVVRDVPDGAVVAGNPARVIRQVDEIEAYRRVNG